MSPKKNLNWFPVITRKGQPVLFNSLVLTAFQDQYYQEVLFLPRGIHFLKYIGGTAGLVELEAKDAGILGANLAQRLTPEYLSFFIAQCRHKSNRLLRTAREIRLQASYDRMNNADLAVTFTSYTSDVVRVMTFLTTIVVFEGVLQKALEEGLSAHIQKHNIMVNPKAQLISLILPQVKNVPSLAIIKLYKLAEQVYSDTSLRELFNLKPKGILSKIKKKFPKFKIKLDSYLDNYDFMDMEYYAGNPLSMEALISRIKDVGPNARRRLAQHEKDRKTTKKELEKAIRKLKLPPKLLFLIKSTRKIHYLRQYRADALFKAGRDVRERLSTIAQRLGIDYDSLVCLTHDEISKSVINGSLTVSKNTIEARQKSYAILWVDQKRSIVTGKAFTEELSAFPNEKRRVKLLHGSVAFVGRYRGPVVIVTVHEEIEKVRPGDVLVSPMTDPYFVPAMVRAGAIVTDEGGILSHAAIVARELGIPCIVGTKFATKVFKDGDLVEVDAEEGIVRKLH